MNIAELVATLQSQGKDTLASVIESRGGFSVADYSKYLWSYTTGIQLEPELVQAFKMEFQRLEIDESKWDAIINSLNKYRSIQTAPHTGLLDSTSVPALTLQWLTMQSLPEDAYYVVGTFSGIPFGNDSYPGALSCSKQYGLENLINKDCTDFTMFQKRQDDRNRDVPSDMYNRIALYDNKNRDELVYRSTVPEIFKNTYSNLTKPVQDYLVYKNNESDFTKVMLLSATKFAQKFFNNEKIIYVDINEVVSNYLTLVLQNTNHFVYKMFFDKEAHKQVIDIWSHDAHFFYDMVDNKNGKKQVHAYIDEFILKNGKNEEQITPEILVNKLKNDRLCPGVFLGFTILAFLNGFQCFGSFKQVGYLTDYKNTWMENNILGVDITSVRTDSLTTGILPNENERYLTTLDIVLGSSWNPARYVQDFNDIILPMQDRLIAFKK